MEEAWVDVTSRHPFVCKKKKWSGDAPPPSQPIEAVGGEVEELADGLYSAPELGKTHTAILTPVQEEEGFASSS